MARQVRKKMQANTDDLEWLFVADEVYADYGNCTRNLQMFIPYRREWKKPEKYPLVIFIPGAAWYRQEVYNSIPDYSKIAQRGIVTAILQHRESTIAPYPAPVQDAKAAIRYLITKAEQYHIDTEHIYIAGHSSGAHIALMTALTAAHGLYESQLHTDISYKIAGVIAEAAPTDITMCAAEPLPPIFPKGHRPSFDLLGITKLEDNIELVEAASCKKYITKEVKLPPILLFHGTIDSQVNFENSATLFELLKKYDQEVTFIELENGDHAGPLYWTKEVLDLIDEFVKR